MTEQEWFRADKPKPMLEFLRGKTCDRKLRLFAVACCWRIAHLLSHEQLWQAVEVAERFADGLADLGQLRDVLDDADTYDWVGGVDDVAYLVTRPPPGFDVQDVLRLLPRASHALGEIAFPDEDFEYDAYLGAASIRDSEAEAQVSLLQCIFGVLPFRPVSVAPVWLTWHDGLLISMAQKMYDSRDFSDMPVLADALEEAGCDNADILTHCRHPSEHVRGCWVVDSIVGRC